MPTAAEFRGAAEEVQAVAEVMSSMDGAFDSVKQGSGMVGQFSVRTVVETALDGAAGQVPSCCSSLGSVIDDLEWRARECEAYAAELSSWRNALALFNANDDGSGRPPVMPQKPYPWIDV